PAQGLAGPEIAVAQAGNPLRPAFPGDLLPRRVPGFCRPFPARRILGRSRVAFCYQYFGNPDHVGRGMAFFMVQALCRQEWVQSEDHRWQRRFGGRGRMRFVSGAILSVSVLAGFLAAVPLRAEDAPAPVPAPAPATVPAACEVPDYLFSADNALPKVAEAIKASHPLNILVIGSRSSTINVGGASASEAAAYPGQMLAALKAKLPAAVEVNLSVEIQAKKTAEEIASGLGKLVESKKPTLVIWQTGTVDAMRSVDPDDFRSAVDEGVVAAKEAGADVVLVNPQYSPRTESMISASPYLDNMRVVAQEHEVPLFDRFAMMKNWSESGEFDLFTAVHGAELAKRVH